MNSTELRIGNLVYLTCEGHENEPDEIIWSVEDYEFYQDRMDDVQPVPINVERLEMLGFKKMFDPLMNVSVLKYSLDDHTHILIEIIEDYGDLTYIESFESINLNIKIYSIHQLQNLIFALTGEELTLIK